MALLREEHRGGSQAASLRSLMLSARGFYVRNAAIDGTGGVRELSAHVVHVIDQLLLPPPDRAEGGLLPDNQVSSPASRFRAIIVQLHDPAGDETAGVGGDELKRSEWEWAGGDLAVGGGASDQAGGLKEKCPSPMWWEPSSLLALMTLPQLKHHQEPAFITDDGPLPLDFALFQFGTTNLTPAHAPSAASTTDDVTALADVTSPWPASSAVLDDWRGLFGLVGSETY